MRFQGKTPDPDSNPKPGDALPPIITDKQLEYLKKHGPLGDAAEALKDIIPLFVEPPKPAPVTDAAQKAAKGIDVEHSLLNEAFQTAKGLHRSIWNGLWNKGVEVKKQVEHIAQSVIDDVTDLAVGHSTKLNPEALVLKGLKYIDSDLTGLIRDLDQEGVGGEFEFLFKPLRGIAQKPISKGLGMLLKIELGNNPHLKQKILQLAIKKDLYAQIPRLLMADNPERLKAIIEATEMVGAGKFSQLFADEPSLPKDVRAFGNLMKSQGKPTRTLEEAQTLTDKLYGTGKYQLKSLLGVGTIGETYLAETTALLKCKTKNQPKKHLPKGAAEAPCTREVIVKMIKNHITPESMDNERKMLLEYVSLFYDNPDDREYFSTQVNNLYKGWMRELDFREEAESAKFLAKGATRYQVVTPIEVGSLLPGGPGISMVAEKATGISLDRLVSLLETYKNTPDQYTQLLRTTFGPPAKLEEKGLEWLENPGPWIQELPIAFLRAQNEQTLFITPDGIRMGHGDPHSGNVFINVVQGKIKLTYIDTGLTTERSSEEVLNHLGIFLDLITGNYGSLSARLIEQAEHIPSGTTKDALIAKLAKRLEQELFPNSGDMTDLKMINSVVNKALKDFRIVQNQTEAIFFKSQFQTLLTFFQLSNLAGKNFQVIQKSLQDIARGVVLGILRNPQMTLNILYSSLEHVYSKPTRSFQILRRFMKNKD